MESYIYIYIYYNYIHNHLHNLYLGKLCDIDKILVWNNTIIYIDIISTRNMYIM